MDTETEAIKEPKKVRINLEVSSEVRDQLASLQKKTGAASMTEVIRKSLNLLQIVIERTDSGAGVVFRHPSGKDEAVRFLF